MGRAKKSAGQRRNHSRRLATVLPFKAAANQGGARKTSNNDNGIGARLKEFWTEGLVRLPTSFLVENVLAPLYPPKDCAPGRYRDPVGSGKGLRKVRTLG